METSNLLISSFFYCLLLISGYGGVVEGSGGGGGGYRPTKLFVFGDSYADTGNVGKSIGSSWNVPYGITFPGKPAGRFSDGRVLTDYVAKSLGVRSPIPYRWRKLAGNKVRNGINFAYGGSGVFDTMGTLLPNMTTQIDFFQNLINPSSDLDKSSLLLVSLVGNDYGAYISNGGTLQGLPIFITKVVNQLTTNLKRLQGLGATKVVVTGLQPLGCLPRTTWPNFQQCNATANLAVGLHNQLLRKSVAQLNNHTKSPTFFIIDLYNSFTSVIQKGGYLGPFKSPLKPCCVGLSSQYSCGSVDGKGNKMYRVCSDPKSSFFWDDSHPTQAGWADVYENLKPSLQRFIAV